jgi:hypothetical protein
MNEDKNNPIILGSGTLYSMPYDKKTFTTIPEDSELEKKENVFGAIKGGAEFEYTANKYTAVDDSGKRKKTKVTEESAKFKVGLITYAAKMIEEMVNTARVGEVVNGRRKTKIGGLDNYVERYYIYRFVHEDNIDGDIRITFIGNNSVGLKFSFLPDKESQFDPEFEPFPFLDDEGTLFEIWEDDPDWKPETEPTP